MEILKFKFTEQELAKYLKINNLIRIRHLDKKKWGHFTELFTYNTNAIEGSTVLFEEEIDLLNKNKLPINEDEQETLQVAKAIEFIKSSKAKLSINFINKIHKLCFEETKSFAGELRNVSVVIRDYNGNIIHEGAYYKDIVNLLNELFIWYEVNKNKLPPLLLASVLHNQFEHIHPYQDGNGRVGRLLLNYVLLKNNYPPVNILLENRFEYYKCLQIYSKTRNVVHFMRFLIKEYKKQYKGDYK